METRRLGRTEHHSTVAVLGAAAFARATPEETEAGFTAAVEAGVNHLDVAPRYGQAEDLVGPLIPTVREQLFVGCKTTRRDPDGVRAQMEESLAKLHLDRFDLYQMHGVTDRAVLDDRSRAAETILAARDEGLTRFAGITGHDLDAPSTFIEALGRYDLDTVMFPVNARLFADPVYRADAEALLDLCEARDVGVMAIKACARAPWGAGERSATTWYEPVTSPADVERGVRFTLSVPGVHAFCTPGDLGVLRTALAAAAGFLTMEERDREETIKSTDHAMIFPMPTA